MKKLWNSIINFFIFWLQQLTFKLKDQYTASVYTSPSGADTIAVINNTRVGEIQGISYQITKYGDQIRVNGTMTFILFDRHALASCLGVGAETTEIQNAVDIPAFDVILTTKNEIGNISQMKILGCQIISEGQSISVDDIISQQTFTYIAEEVVPWKKLNSEK